MEQTGNQRKGSFSLLKECKSCGHTMLDHSTRSDSEEELETGTCKECDCSGFVE